MTLNFSPVTGIDRAGFPKLPVLRITAEQVMNGVYVGGGECDFPGDIEIAPDLGVVKFTHSLVGYRIRALSGSGIRAEGWIKSTSNIESSEKILSGSWIYADGDIRSGDTITANGWIEGCDIVAEGMITAGSDIRAHRLLKSMDHIRVGNGITAGSQIHAAFGILATNIKCGGRIFAGLGSYREPTDVFDNVICANIERGTVAFGELISPSNWKLGRT